MGVLVFATWGLAVDAPTFVYDFLKVHVGPGSPSTTSGSPTMRRSGTPRFPELWAEFAARYGIVFTVASAAASLWALRSVFPRVRACGALLLGALVFSLTDWRQTKHLSLLVAPALLALAAACPVRAACPPRLPRATRGDDRVQPGDGLAAAPRLLGLAPSTIW